MQEIEEIQWDEAALNWAALWGLTAPDVEAAVYNPQQSAVDPRTAEVDYQIMRYRRGDVVVVVGYRQPTRPKILFVTTVTGLERAKKVKVGSTTGSTMPRSYRELRKRIITLGYTIPAGHDHPPVLTKDGRRICTLPGTSSDVRALANTWRDFARGHKDEMLREIRERKEKSDD